ncbi:Putative surface antigen transporter [Nitrosotalea devaniterrae]|uniref:Surface antigen transporter n=2 Tax=cellular organisms TaxID=131567 RepID=A0A128A0Z3_9ARCH|nr:Putative surface antigen transporter [Candidatus Nitrosotalea devanaterra]
MSNIRVTYSGLIAFVVSFASVITGTFFVIIVTRRLTPDEFGTWTLVNSMLFYVLILEPIISNWSSRQVARGEKVGKTAIFTGSLFSAGGSAIFIVMMIFVSHNLGADLNILLLAAALVPLNIINGVLGSVCLGYKPHFVSYGLFAFETSKPPIGFVFVYLLHFGIVGAFLTVILSSLIRTILLIIAARNIISGKIEKQTIKFWLKMSWLVTYQNIAGIIFRLDVILVSLVFHSLSILAFWGASQTIGYVVLNAGNIAQALYSKLLATGKKALAEETLTRTIFFAIPITATCIVFAKPALHVLNPLYDGAIYSVWFVTLASLFSTIKTVNYGILTSYETVDMGQQASFKAYVRSKLFSVPTLNYVSYISYVALLALFLFVMRTPQMSQLFIVSIWSLILLVTTIPVTAYTTIIVKKQHNVNFQYGTITRYVIVAIFSSLVVFFISDGVLEYPENIFEFIVQVIPFMLVGAFLYFGINYLIDVSTKNLFRSIVKELMKK